MQYTLEADEIAENVGDDKNPKYQLKDSKHLKEAMEKM